MTTVKVRRIVKLEVEVPNLPGQIQEAFKKCDKSVAQVCDEVDISRSYWYSLIRGKELAIAEDTLLKIQTALDADFGVKFDDKSKP